MPPKKTIHIIDDTLREGMQYRGLMFSCKQRLQILKFQEQLGVDICRAGYPPAHDQETDIVKNLAEYAENSKYKINIAAMGRACQEDTDLMLATGVSHFHLHLDTQFKTADQLDHTLQKLWQLIMSIRTKKPGASICLVMMDLGKTSEQLITKIMSFFSTHRVELISLADTSGILTPDLIFDKISRMTKKTKLSIHCHNDLGMASANTFMGLKAGASCFEASVLGIGERNGIADLYTTAIALKNQGFVLNLKTEDIDTFMAYYKYIDDILHQQHNDRLIKFNTPIFGDGVKTHVAGTHALDVYAPQAEELVFLNSLCGKKLVKRFLTSHQIECPDTLLPELTWQIKKKSIKLNRCLTADDVKRLLQSL